jgi:hypothetical protein
MPIVFPAGELVVLVAESHAENSVGVCRLAPHRSCGAFLLVDFRAAVQLEQFCVRFAQLVRYLTARNVNHAPRIL